MIETLPPRVPLRRAPEDATAWSCRREAVGSVGAALALMLAMLGGAGAAETPAQVPITVTAKGCEPMELTVPAGVTTFVITNRSSRALEWEILDGVMVVDERENIAPGFKQRLTTRLKPGSYQITCGLLDNPRGRLTVTSDGSGPARPSAADLIGVVAEYRVGTAAVLGDLADAVARLQAARGAGDGAAVGRGIAEVRGLFLATVPLHGLAGAAVKPLADDLAALDAAQAATPPGDVGPAVDGLVRDLPAFTAAVRPLVAPADRLIGETVALAQRTAAEFGAEAPLPAAALATAEGRRAAIERVVSLFAPAIPDAAAVSGLNEASTRLRDELARAPGPIGGFADARTLDPDLRRAQAAAATDLARRLAALTGLLGL